MDARKKEEMKQAKLQVGREIDALELNADEIVDGLFLGSEDAAGDVEALRKHNIRHVLVPARTSMQRVKFEGDVNYLVWDVYDVPAYPIIWCFDAFTEYIRQALDKKEGVLVHCANGVSRSPAIVCAFLLKSGYAPQDESPARQVDTCFTIIRKKRQGVSNRKFRDQLELYVKLGVSLEPYRSLVAQKPGTSSTARKELGAELVAELSKYSIRQKPNMKDAYLGKVQTFWPQKDHAKSDE